MSELRARQIRDEDIVTDDELGAGKKDTLIVDGVFPVSLASTASATKTVTIASGNIYHWDLQVGDTAVIANSTEAGDYTVASLVSATEFTVNEAIGDTSGTGDVTVYHPVGARQVGVDNAEWTNVTGTNVQEAITSIDGQVSSSGISATQHEDLDTLTHRLSETHYQEATYDGVGKVTNVTAWIDNTKTTKVRELQVSYTGNKITQTIEIQYDGSGNEKVRLTCSYTYSGNRLTSSDCTEV